MHMYIKYPPKGNLYTKNSAIDLKIEGFQGLLKAKEDSAERSLTSSSEEKFPWVSQVCQIVGLKSNLIDKFKGRAHWKLVNHPRLNLQPPMEPLYVCQAQ